MKWILLVVLCGCGLDLDPPPPLVHARFDPDAKVIPMPTNVLRDELNRRLDLPLDDDTLTAAEREFYTFLNTMDGWSSAMAATVEFTAPVDAATIDADTVQVWKWGVVPERVTGLVPVLDDDGMKLTIDAPRAGWERGGTYTVVVRGGAEGVKGAAGERVECDAAFYFLRLDQPLDVPEHNRAFPGDTRAERAENADKLEEIRQDLAPYFQHFEQLGLPRADVAALWSFTITTHTELAMDKASQRMPLPFDLLLDPATGRVDLPVAAWDSPTVAEAKVNLRAYDGFAVSADLMFELTGPIDPATAQGDGVQLWRVSPGAPARLPAVVDVYDGNRHLLVRPTDGRPLAEQSRYAVIVTTAVKDVDGVAVLPMPVGHFVRGVAPVAVDGVSQIDAVDDEDAARVEGVRLEIAPLLDMLGRGDVVAAWPFTTMSIREHLEAKVAAPAVTQVDPDPQDVIERSPGQAAADFAIGSLSLFQVDSVFYGTIASPVYLDPITRADRTDGGYVVQEIPFTMTIPYLTPGEPMPVVIFGHGLMTERRFVLSLGDALASRGYAVVSIDFPFHGTRTACSWSGPLCFADPVSGSETCPDPCVAGATCREDGRCVDAGGGDGPENLAQWPIIGYPQASGAAFIEVENIAGTRDHFEQSLVDLAALARSLRTGDWDAAVGHPIDEARIYYAGQSLGGIVGATYVALDPLVTRAVLNVPGADTVDMFTDSTVFGNHVLAFFTREGIAQGTADAERFFNVARWFMDATDPHSVVDTLAPGRAVMIQMATLDFVIPNQYTTYLGDLSGVPRRDYVAEHAFIVIPVEPEYGRGTSELAGFLDGTFSP